MNAESKTFEISSRVFKVLKEVCEVSAFAVSRFKDSRAEHTQVLHINVCIFTTADKQSVFLYNCVLRSQSFVFCFVAQIRSYLHIGLFDLVWEISLPISEYQVKRDSILEYPSTESILVLNGNYV